MKSPNGLHNLPIDSVVKTYGFGASPVKATIVSKQRHSDDTYGVQTDYGATGRILPDDIVQVVSVSSRKD